MGDEDFILGTIVNVGAASGLPAVPKADQSYRREHQPFGYALPRVTAERKKPKKKGRKSR